MNGLVYLLDQAGLALQQANAHIARLEAELAGLRADDEPPHHRLRRTVRLAKISRTP